MVGDDLERVVAQIGAAGLAGSRANQLVKQVDLVVAVLVLQYRRQALESHAGIDPGCRQRPERTVLLHIELHEHVVPDLDVAVAIGVG